MQFEVTLMRRPETKQLEGTAIWVEKMPQTVQEVRGGRFCACDKEWRVIYESLPEGSAKVFLGRIRAEGAVLAMCPCNGKIIE